MLSTAFGFFFHATKIMYTGTEVSIMLSPITEKNAQQSHFKQNNIPVERKKEESKKILNRNFTNKKLLSEVLNKNCVENDFIFVLLNTVHPNNKILKPCKNEVIFIMFG